MPGNEEPFSNTDDQEVAGHGATSDAEMDWLEARRNWAQLGPRWLRDYPGRAWAAFGGAIATLAILAFLLR